MTDIDVDAVVFDKGNTLLMDPFGPVMRLKAEAFARLFDKHGIALGREKISLAWTNANSSVNYPYIGHFTQEEPIIQHALRQLGVPAATAAFLGPELLAEYRRGLKETIEKDPRTSEVRETLQELGLRGYRLGAFSNDRIAGLGMELAWMGLGGLFEYAETSESTQLEKPDPGVYAHILCGFRLPAERVAYVGDDPVRDIAAAKKAGLKAVLYSVDAKKYQTSWRDYETEAGCEPDAVVSSFGELLEVFPRKQKQGQ